LLQLIIFILLSFGLTAFIVDASLLAGPRGWLAKFEEIKVRHELNDDGSTLPAKTIILAWLSEGLSCYQCTGFHIGWFLYLGGFSGTGHWAADMFVASGSCMLLAKLLEGKNE